MSKVREKIKAALTEKEFELFEKMVNDALEMYALLNDRVNRDTRDSFGALIGEDNIPKTWKVMDELEWEERAHEVLGGTE